MSSEFFGVLKRHQNSALRPCNKGFMNVDRFCSPLPMTASELGVSVVISTAQDDLTTSRQPAVYGTIADNPEQ
jgi:hypothetical protein